MSKSINPLFAMGRSPIAIGLNIGMKDSRGVLLPKSYKCRAAGAFVEQLAFIARNDGAKAGKLKGYIRLDKLSEIATVEKAKANRVAVPVTSAGGSNSILSHLGSYAEQRGYNYEILCTGKDVMDVASYHIALWHCAGDDPRKAAPKKVRKAAKPKAAKPKAAPVKRPTADVVQMPQAAGAAE